MTYSGLSVQSLSVSVLGLVCLCQAWGACAKCVVSVPNLVCLCSAWDTCAKCVLSVPILVCLCSTGRVCAKLGIPAPGLGNCFHMPSSADFRDFS